MKLNDNEYVVNKSGGDANNSNIALNANKVNPSANYTAYCRWYAFAISDGDTPLLNFVPCKRKSDSKPGFYDTVRREFFASDGTADFIAGPEIESQTIPVVFPAMGKNLFDPDSVTLGKAISENGAIIDNALSCYSEIIPVTPGGYAYSGICGNPEGAIGNNKRIHGYADGVWQGQLKLLYVSPGSSFSTTFTVPEGINGIRISAYSSDTNRQVEKGSATTYEPYTNTIYGGQVDPVTGVGSAEWQRYDMGDYTWNKNGSIFQTDHSVWATGTVGNENVISECYDTAPGVSLASSQNIPDKSISLVSGRSRIVIKDSDYSDGTELQNSLSGMHMVIKLKDPIPFTVDPVTIQTLIGTNTIWTDTNGSNTVKYLKKG